MCCCLFSFFLFLLLMMFDVASIINRIQNIFLCFWWCIVEGIPKLKKIKIKTLLPFLHVPVTPFDLICSYFFSLKSFTEFFWSLNAKSCQFFWNNFVVSKLFLRFVVVWLEKKISLIVKIKSIVRQSISIDVLEVVFHLLNTGNMFSNLSSSIFWLHFDRSFVLSWRVSPPRSPSPHFLPFLIYQSFCFFFI